MLRAHDARRVSIGFLEKDQNPLTILISFHCSANYRGAGGPVPYRIYVDSGVVFLCLMALAPASPLVAPAALVYFLFFSPLLRWLLVFVYRPDYDGGGQRWPLLFDILMSGMTLAQVRGIMSGKLVFSLWL